MLDEIAKKNRDIVRESDPTNTNKTEGIGPQITQMTQIQGKDAVGYISSSGSLQTRKPKGFHAKAQRREEVIRRHNRRMA
jgi:hypothetical protein